MLINIPKSIYNWLVCPHRIVILKKHLETDSPLILDVGCGNHSPRNTRRYLPACRYEGVYNERWNLNEEDDRNMEQSFEIDLENPDSVDHIPEAHYDAVICSHILEHLSSPYDVLQRLLGKVVQGGVLYVEVPSERSAGLPRAKDGWLMFRGCLNFYDDETHKMMVDIGRVAEIMTADGFRVIGPKRCLLWRKVILLPFYILGTLITKGFVPASVLWDVMGFAVCVSGVKGSGKDG